MTTPLAAALTPLELLRDHIGHRCHIIEPSPGRSIAIRCSNCTKTIDLSGVFGLRPSGAAATSTPVPPTPHPAPPARRGIPHLNDPDACPLHTGYWADNCGPCRSEVIADEDRIANRPPGADPTPEYRAARADLRRRAERSTHEQETP